MISDPRISELLVETGAYRDLDKPVILASGQLGIFYINTEKLCQDGGEFERYGDDSRAMMNHAIRMMGEHPSFEEVIDVLAENASRLLPKVGHRRISGGQRRDWIFSGPVANKLSLPHLSIYKDGRIEEVVVYNKCLYPVVPSDSSFVFSKPLKEISNSSPISYIARLFIKDYHNIRGSTSIEVASSSPVSWRKSAFRLVD